MLCEALLWVLVTVSRKKIYHQYWAWLTPLVGVNVYRRSPEVNPGNSTPCLFKSK